MNIFGNSSKYTCSAKNNSLKVLFLMDIEYLNTLVYLTSVHNFFPPINSRSGECILYIDFIYIFKPIAV